MSGFIGGLAAHIQSLLDFKHAIGFPYDTPERILRQFDAMCAQSYPGQTRLTKEMAMAWAAARDGEHVNGQLRRITPVRQLGKHMNTMGVEAYVIPAGIPGRQIRYRPHLFTKEQLRAIFDAADELPASPSGGQRHLVIPVIFRMMYCLGLRPGEARRLHRNDVDLDRGAVRIRESKGHKDRMVFMSTDLHRYCRDYDAAISAHQPERMPFFPDHAGTFYAISTISVWFNELVAAADPRSSRWQPRRRPGSGAAAAPQSAPESRLSRRAAYEQHPSSVDERR